MPSFKVCGGIETNGNKSINVSNGLDFLKYVYSSLSKNSKQGFEICLFKAHHIMAFFAFHFPAVSLVSEP